MRQPVLTAEEVLRWNEATSAAWRKLLGEHPELLWVSCDIAQTSTVAEMLQHIVAVELRFAERLAGAPETDYAEILYDTVENIYVTHDRAIVLYRQALAADLDWEKTMEFKTRSGAAKASLKTMLFHALLHSQRHYAQLGTLVRQHGHTIEGPGDYLPMEMTWG
ncbi:DinB family protein [Edaphobacter aggregans]|uniref:DinB family protein n=1 Tax=Edaphobacter aggregans TaxID=570835 RepID=UPI0005525972|nr:DinB family protein [Edaphobacter aggregans]